jgi:uncharacterized membrane protein
MHLIPHSWAHFHILVSVFPSVGLVFAIGFYVAALRTENETLKRTCLLVFTLLGLLAIPTYFSGEGAQEALASDSRFNPEWIATHYGWSLAGLAMLAATGLVSLINLFRFRGKRLSDNAGHLVLGLALITLGLMAIVGELGWEINHQELFIEPAKQKTPELWSHFHMILNHFPTVGFVFALGFYLTALVLNNVAMKRGGLVLFVICAIVIVPTFVTGNASMLAVTDNPIDGISKAVINEHRDMAVWALFAMAFTGVTAWIELWRFRYHGRFSNRMLYLVLLFAIIALGVMAETGHRGGQINHPEIRTEPVPTDITGYLSPYVENMINNVIWFVPWQTVHFFGYSIVFGVVTAVVLRIFGFWKSMPFSAVHRLLPLGVFGVTMNVFTGMLMLMADTFRYVNETSFIPKMFLLPIGATAVLYFSLNDALWATKAGEDAPMQAKWFAALLLIAWTGVIMGGRLLPYV